MNHITDTPIAVIYNTFRDEIKENDINITEIRFWLADNGYTDRGCKKLSFKELKEFSAEICKKILKGNFPSSEQIHKVFWTLVDTAAGETYHYYWPAGVEDEKKLI